MTCLDTSVLIDIIRGNESVRELSDKIDKTEIIPSIASPSIVELIKGINLKDNLKYIRIEKREKIGEILSRFSILSLDMESAVLAGKIEAELINKGKMVDIEDIMIAAIAIENDETLITRNTKHFENIKGLKVENY